MKKTSTWLYKSVQPIAAFLLKIIYQHKIINKNVIPKEGSIILSGNHKMALDPLLVSARNKKDDSLLSKRCIF